MTEIILKTLSTRDNELDSHRARQKAAKKLKVVLPYLQIFQQNMFGSRQQEQQEVFWR